MRRIWFIAKKDLVQTSRDRLAALFVVILPVVFTVVLGLVMSSSDREYFPLAVANQDGGQAATRLVELLEQSPVVRLWDKPAAEIDKQVQDENFAAGLIIPQGFSASLDAGQSVKLDFVAVPTSSGGQSVWRAVDAAVKTLAVEHLATNIAVKETQQAGTAAGTASGAAGADAKQTAAGAVAQSLAAPVVALVQRDVNTETQQQAGGFDQSSPGELVNWILFSLLSIAIGVVMERRSGALSRLATTRTSRAEVLGGKALGMVIITFAQQVFLILLGRFAFGVDYFRSPLALLLVMVSLSVLAATIGLLIAALLRTEQAVVATTVIAAMLLAALGGAWFPLEVASASFSRVAHVLPTAWVIDAFHGIILQGWGLGDVLLPLAVVWGWIVVVAAVAVWRFRPSAKLAG